jgi:AraC-like DNA-binding protein
MMHYKQIIPPDHLKQWVRFFWAFETDGEVSHVLNPLADGCPGIIFQDASDGQFHDTAKHLMPEIFLYGQTISCSPLSLNGKFKTVGICFYPSVLKSLFRINASELTDSCVDVTLVIDQLREPLANSLSVSEKIETFSCRIWDIVKKMKPAADSATDFAIRRIVETNGNIQLRSLQKEMKLSERGLQRKFDQYVGISPKLFSRVCRFQASLTQFRKSNFHNLSDIAFDNGYADQSHFIRTFKEFAGFSPLQFKKSKRTLTPNFTVS